MRKKIKKPVVRKPKAKNKIAANVPDYWQNAVNKLVSYYEEGWRYGYLSGFTKMGAAKIQPIGARGGQIPHIKTIALDDLGKVQEKKEEE